MTAADATVLLIAKFYSMGASDFIRKPFVEHVLFRKLDSQIKLTLTPEARQTIALRGYNQQYGARPVLGIIRKELRHPISKMMIAGKIKSGDHIEVQIDKDGNPLITVKEK